MNATTMAEPATTVFVPTGHPIRRFVIGLGVIAAAATALWWSALLAPRLSVGATEGTYNTESLRGTFSYELRNGGPFPIEVRGVEIDNPGVRIRDVRVAGVEPAVADSIDGAATTSVEARFVIDCARYTTSGPPELKITVETAIGLVRTQALDALDTFSNAASNCTLPQLPPPPGGQELPDPGTPLP